MKTSIHESLSDEKRQATTITTWIQQLSYMWCSKIMHWETQRLNEHSPNMKYQIVIPKSPCPCFKLCQTMAAVEEISLRLGPRLLESRLPGSQVSTITVTIQTGRCIRCVNFIYRVTIFHLCIGEDVLRSLSRDTLGDSLSMPAQVGSDWTGKAERYSPGQTSNDEHLNRNWGQNIAKTWTILTWRFPGKTTTYQALV
jgi:hypothetical protein